jgi:F-type H+-transporting ATPase subunit b
MRVSGTCRSSLLWVLVFLGLPVGAAWGASGGITVLPDSSVFIQIFNFIFLILALNVLVYKPIRRILVERKQKIDGLEGTIDGLHGDAQKSENDYVMGIKEARITGLGEKTTLINAAESEEKQIIDRINQKASEELAIIRKKITKDIDDVRTSLQKDVDSFVEAIGQKILGRSV